MTRLAVFGGPYSNPYALQALLEDARRRHCERIVCLGDLGGFGAEPNEVWDLLRRVGVECIAGNYDVAIGRGDPDCGCGYRDPIDNQFAQIAYDYTRAHTSVAFATWMRTLPTERREVIDGAELHMVHGSPLGLNDFFWESLPDDEVRRRIDASGAAVIVCTHSGLPWQRRMDGTLVVNVGVIGRPANDGRNEVWYAVVDLAAGEAEAELVPLSYDWAAQAASMRAAGLPDAFTETIETGWWTSCLQILPPVERARGRFQLYRSELARGAEHDGLEPVPDDDPARPVVALFGSARFPRRLWIEHGLPDALGDEADAAGFVDIRTVEGGTAPPAGELVARRAGWFAPELVAPPGTPLAVVKTRVIERILAALPPAYACATPDP